MSWSWLVLCSARVRLVFNTSCRVYCHCQSCAMYSTELSYLLREKPRNRIKLRTARTVRPQTSVSHFIRLLPLLPSLPSVPPVWTCSVLLCCCVLLLLFQQLPPLAPRIYSPGGGHCWWCETSSDYLAGQHAITKPNPAGNHLTGHSDLLSVLHPSLLIVRSFLSDHISVSIPPPGCHRYHTRHSFSFFRISIPVLR